MNTKKLLKYGAIAVGAYLAYTMLFKKKSSDANFANATGLQWPRYHSHLMCT